MKSILFAVLMATGLMLLPCTVPAQAWSNTDDYDDEAGMYESGMGMGGMGMGGSMGSGGYGMGGCGMMPQGYGRGGGMMGFQAFRMLDLNPDQRSRLNKIQNDLQKQHWNLQGRVLDERAKLYDLYASEKPDSKKIGQVYGTIFDIRQQMIESRIDAMNRARDILSREQQQKLSQFRQSHQGWGAGGPHGGMMQQMMKSRGTNTP